MGLELFVHQRFHLMHDARSERHHAQVVAVKLHRVVVVREGWELLEDRGFFRILDVWLKREHAARLHQLVDGVLQAQQLDIGGLVVARAAEQGAEDAEALLEYRAGIANHERADGRAQNDQELEWLPEHIDVPAGCHVTPKHAGENDNSSDNKPHAPVLRCYAGWLARQQRSVGKSRGPFSPVRIHQHAGSTHQYRPLCEADLLGAQPVCPISTVTVKIRLTLPETPGVRHHGRRFAFTRACTTASDGYVAAVGPLSVRSVR